MEHLRDVGSTRCTVLGWDDGLLSTAIPDPRRAEVVVRAANDWLVEQWLSDDRAVFGMMLIPSALPDVAASEIRRIGCNQRIVAVALGCNALGRPFGDRIYLPIFEAAVEMGLPVVLQIGSDNATDQITPPVAGGVPATYAEYRVLSVHSHMAHLGSMIVEGLFERMPELQVLLIGGGFTLDSGLALARRSVDQAVETNAGAVAAPSPRRVFRRTRQGDERLAREAPPRRATRAGPRGDSGPRADACVCELLSAQRLRGPERSSGACRLVGVTGSCARTLVGSIAGHPAFGQLPRPWVRHPADMRR